MSHSKGFLQGRCNGKWRNVGRKKLGFQQQKCSRCSRVRMHKIGRCFLFHDWRDRGTANHGKQPQRCEKCGETRTETFSGCGLLRRCRWHNTCDKQSGIHCKICGRQARQLWRRGQARGRAQPETEPCSGQESGALRSSNAKHQKHS